jgi:hypothetical protein
VALHSTSTSRRPSAVCKQSSSTSNNPATIQQHSVSETINALRLALFATSSILLPSNANADNPVLSYVDNQENFSITLPAGFVSVPRKSSQSKGSTGAAQPVEVLLTANNFASQAAISVGKTYVPQLLEDFSVPWSKRAISKIGDVGTARIVAELLILQRQGAFGSEWFKTKLAVTDDNEAALTNMDQNISQVLSAVEDTNSVTFEFLTPVSVGVRHTTVKSILKGNYLFTSWLSAMDSNWNKPEFRQQLVDSRESFMLVN